MANAKRKMSGFLWAMILAVISFFIIFIFFPDVSDKFFGVSLKEPTRIGESVKDAVETSTQTVIDKTVEVVSEKIGDAVSNTLSSK